jgi:hypothetical protein
MRFYTANLPLSYGCHHSKVFFQFLPFFRSVLFVLPLVPTFILGPSRVVYAAVL